MSDDERKYSAETHRLVYHDKTGSKLVIRPDADGLGLVEVDGAHDFGRLVLDPIAAVKVAKAMAELAEEMLGSK